MPETLIPKIKQETLAEMIGATRSRVSFFMNRFRKLSFIEYNGRVKVYKSLLNVVRHDQVSEQNAVGASLMGHSAGSIKPAKRGAARVSKIEQNTD